MQLKKKTAFIQSSRGAYTNPFFLIFSRLDKPYSKIALYGKISDRFIKKEFDEGIGLQYHGGRYYDPDIGKWISPDPLDEFHDPYAYGPGDPINGKDVDGRVWKTIRVEYSNRAGNVMYNAPLVFASSKNKAGRSAWGLDASKLKDLRVRKITQRWERDPGNPWADRAYQIGTERQITQRKMTGDQAVRLIREYDLKHGSTSLLPMEPFMFGPFVPDITYLEGFPSEQITHIPEPSGNVYVDEAEFMELNPELE